MLDTLSDKFEGALRRLRGLSRVSEADLDNVLEEIRAALLEADVNLEVVKQLSSSVRSALSGNKVPKALNPEQYIIKAFFDALVVAMGEHAPLNLRHAPPAIIMVVGLQGSGKTTSCVKLANLIKTELRRNPAVVSLDIYRPAAIEQLRILATSANIECIPSTIDEAPVDIAKRALATARSTGIDTLIIDTAGRLQIDDSLMRELAQVAREVEPHEILLVADAMTGQEAANVAKTFDQRLDLDGFILTKLDGDTRGGAALSMRAVTGKPIKFLGIGEKTSALEVFHPDRLASRILGMGDILTLVEKASKQISVEDASLLSKKLKRSEFTLDDFLSQLNTIKSMGSVASLVKMIPGMGKVVKGVDEGLMDKEMKRMEAIILSMTKDERANPGAIDGSRKLRIANGSGTTQEEVNRMLKQFLDMSKMMKQVMKAGPRGLQSLGNMFKQGGMPRGF